MVLQTTLAGVFHQPSSTHVHLLAVAVLVGLYWPLFRYQLKSVHDWYAAVVLYCKEAAGIDLCCDLGWCCHQGLQTFLSTLQHKMHPQTWTVSSHTKHTWSVQCQQRCRNIPYVSEFGQGIDQGFSFLEVSDGPNFPKSFVCTGVSQRVRACRNISAVHILWPCFLAKSEMFRSLLWFTAPVSNSIVIESWMHGVRE